MTAKKDLKRLVRARLKKTGESYAAALRQIRKHIPGAPAAAVPALRRVEKPEFGFALRVPGDWREDRPDPFYNSDEVARFFGTGPDLQNCLVFRKPAEPGADAQRIARNAQAHFGETGYGNFRRSGVAVAGLPGARLDFDRPNGWGEGVWALRHYFVVAGHVFVASFGTTRPQRDAGLVDALAAGFELIGSPPGAAAVGPSGGQVHPPVRRTVVDPDTKRRFAAYSLRARQVVIAALEEAVKRGRAAIDQEDLLSGVAVVDASAGLAILADLGISQARLQRAVETAFPPGPMAADRGEPDDAGGAHEAIPLCLTERAERTLTLAEEESRALGHSYLGVEHLLLGLVLEGTGHGSELLASLGVTPTAARAAFHRFLDTPAHRTWLGIERPTPSGE